MRPDLQIKTALGWVWQGVFMAMGNVDSLAFSKFSWVMMMMMMMMKVFLYSHLRPDDKCYGVTILLVFWPRNPSEELATTFYFTPNAET